MSATLIPIVAIAGAFVVPIVGMVVYYTFLAWKTWHDTALKRDMVARGYTAQEIIEVIAAGQDSETGPFQRAFHGPANSAGSQLPNVPPAKPIKQPSYG